MSAGVLVSIFDFLSRDAHFDAIFPVMAEHVLPRIMVYGGYFICDELVDYVVLVGGAYDELVDEVA